MQFWSEEYRNYDVGSDCDSIHYKLLFSCAYQQSDDTLCFFRIKHLLSLLCRPCAAAKRMEQGIELETRLERSGGGGDTANGGGGKIENLELTKSTTGDYAVK